MSSLSLLKSGNGCCRTAARRTSPSAEGRKNIIICKHGERRAHQSAIADCRLLIIACDFDKVGVTEFDARVSSEDRDLDFGSLSLFVDRFDLADEVGHRAGSDLDHIALVEFNFQRDLSVDAEPLDLFGRQRHRTAA